MREQTISVCSQNHFSDNCLNVHVYNNAVLRPTIGLTVGRDLCEPSLKYLTTDMSQFTFDETYVEEIDLPTFYLGRLITRWGHCITSDLMNVWPLFEPEWREKYRGLKLAYVVDTEGLAMPSNFWEMLRCLGISTENVLFVTKSTLFKKLYVPDPCYYYDEQNDGNQRYTKEYAQMIDAIVKSVPVLPDSPKKVFMSRARLKVNHRDYGERVVESVFKASGYQIVYPESLSFTEMVSMMKGCSSFASTEGSCAHNSVFLSEGSECVIVRKVDWANPYQALIDEVRNLNVTYIDSHYSFLLYNNNCPWDGPFFLYCNKNLRRWSHCWRPFPIVSFSRYFFHYLNKWMKVNVFPKFKLYR